MLPTTRMYILAGALWALLGAATVNALTERKCNSISAFYFILKIHGTETWDQSMGAWSMNAFTQRKCNSYSVDASLLHPHSIMGQEHGIRPTNSRITWPHR